MRTRERAVSVKKKASQDIDVAQELSNLHAKRTRMEAIARLGQAGAVDAVQPLLGLYESANRKGQDAICEALTAIAEADETGIALQALVEQGVESESKPARRCALRVLADLRESASPALPALLSLAIGEGQTAPETRAAILEIASQIGGDEVVAAATALAENAEPKVRLAAVRALVDVDSESSTAHLVELARALPKGKRRALAIKGLRPRYEQLLDRIRGGAYDEVPVLLDVWRALGSKRSRASKEIFAGLVNTGQPLVTALCATLDGVSPAADTIRVLEKMGLQGRLETDTQSCAAVTAELDNPDTATACVAARVLGMMGDERAIPPLAARLSFDPGLLGAKKTKAKQALGRATALQRAAAIGLGRMGMPALPAALRAARSEDTVTRCGGIIALGRIGALRGLGTLDVALQDPEPMVREAAAGAMERVARNDVHRLGAMLESKDAKVRLKAVKALGKLDDLRSLDLLLRAYGDANDRVNRTVVKSLIRREGGRSTSMLVAAAAGGNLSALRGLEKQPTPQAIPALIEALDAPWSEEVSVALHTLRTYAQTFASDPDAVEALRAGVDSLRSLLLDETHQVREMAAQTLGLLQEERAVADLAFLLSDSRKPVRLAALGAIESIDGKAAQQALQAYVESHAAVKGQARREMLEQVSEALQRLTQTEAEDQEEPPATV